MSDEVLIRLAYLAMFLVLTSVGIAMWMAGKEGDE